MYQYVAYSASCLEDMISAIYDLYPPTLRQNFTLMGGTFGRGLNHNSDRNTGAELGGTDRISHLLK